ncbi:MAG: aminotransferase class V-fold PLP-dependent enzyme [Bacteroidales bacterium]|nr:aminotransferase class V-fold PLP-dependent enzyme [Bacteroidales bacterium]
MNEEALRFVRCQFPALNGEWIFLDNAGGSQTAKQVGERITQYLYQSNVQLGASYDVSVRAGERVTQSQKTMAEFVNARDEKEIILGPSTTQLLQNLSKSLLQLFKPGDEVIVTNCDHEANIGPWMNMMKSGIVVKTWKINPETFSLDLSSLKKLMTPRTKLVAFTHVSNVVGTINPVKEITSFVHERGAMVCVDGVAFAPHRQVDVRDWDVDFYAFSFYKVYGPHYSLLYAKRDILGKLTGINHYFIGRQDIPYKLQPGNVNFELTYGLLGVTDYFDAVYDFLHPGSKKGLRNRLDELYKLFSENEAYLASLLIDFLKSKKEVKIIGEKSADPGIRVPTISFIKTGNKSSEIPPVTDAHQIGIRYGDFYARRLIESLGLAETDGVVRISLVHYNTGDEINKLIHILDRVL